MTHVSILITPPSAALAGEIARCRPDWRTILLSDGLPSIPHPTQVWGFVDWLCPTMSGLETCRRLREYEPTRAAHLTMVLEEPGSDASRRALQAGADDYMVGPLDAGRVIERIETLGMNAPAPGQRLSHGVMTLDPAAFQVRIDGRPVVLRPNEFRLLAHFIKNPDQVFSRTSLIERLGKDEEHIDERTVDVWVGRLRRALAAHDVPDPLRTVRSLGYVLDSL